MAVESVCCFDIFGHHITITPEFDQYNMTRSKQAREIGAIAKRYTGEDVLAQLQSDVNRLIENALDSFRQVVDTQINTAVDVAVIGFSELQRQQEEVLPRIGKRMIFKYTPNEYINVKEVAAHLILDTQSYFAGFVQEVEHLEKEKKDFRVQQAYNRLTQSQPAMIGIGFGAKGAMEVAAGNVALSAGMGAIKGIGNLIANAIQASMDSSNEKQAVSHGRKALYEAYQEICNQLTQYTYQYMYDMMQEDISKVGAIPFRNIPEDQEKMTKAKWENYKSAYRQGDITSERYVDFLISMVEELPHRLTVYYDLYQVAFDLQDEEAQKSILDFTDYLGFDGQMKRWMARQGMTPPIRIKEDVVKPAGIFCSNCGKENKENARFCKSCGQMLGKVRVCSACGNEIKPGKKFCSKCGMAIN